MALSAQMQVEVLKKASWQTKEASTSKCSFSFTNYLCPLHVHNDKPCLPPRWSNWEKRANNGRLIVSSSASNLSWTPFSKWACSAVCHCHCHCWRLQPFNWQLSEGQCLYVAETLAISLSCFHLNWFIYWTFNTRAIDVRVDRLVEAAVDSSWQQSKVERKIYRSRIN